MEEGALVNLSAGTQDRAGPGTGPASPWLRLLGRRMLSVGSISLEPAGQQAGARKDWHMDAPLSEDKGRGCRRPVFPIRGAGSLGVREIE